MADLIATAENLTDLAAAKAPAEKRSNKLKIPKKILTDKTIKKLLKNKTRADPGQRYTIWDASLDGFGVRVTDNHLSYVFAGRFPGSKHWTRREIGACDAMTFAAARAKAKMWIELAAEGKDPKAEAARLEKEEARKKAHTFAAVAEEFIKDRVIGPNPDRPIQRKWKWVSRTIRDPFISTWKETPIANISRDDVLAIIKLKKRRHPAEARSQLAIIKVLFGWALNQSYGLERSVCSDIKPKDVIGEKTPRDRVLSDDEVRALWATADQFTYPIREIYQLLMLSGLRLNEVARATRHEFDLRKKEWVIPAARMKGRNVGSDGKRAKPHLVPLTEQMLQIFDSLPRFNSTDLLFSTTKGKKPFWLGSKVKKAIDGKVLEQLRLIAKERGDDPQKVALEKWVNHDIRRTVRTNLSALKVQEEVGEAILAHAKVGISKVYNLHQYSAEKREALEAWAVRLHEIVNPPEQPEPEPESESVDDSNIFHLPQKAGRQ
jgi:integrase